MDSKKTAELTTRTTECRVIAPLRDFRQEHSRVLGVLVEIGAKFLRQERFLAAGFDVERKPDDDEADQTAHFTQGYHVAEEREQDSGVDRMSNGPIGPGADQFVTFFEGDDAAPVRAKMVARPTRDADACGGEKNAEPFHQRRARHKSRAQPAVAEAATIDKKEGREERHYVDQPLDPQFAALCLFPIQRGDQPVQTEQGPQIPDASGWGGSEAPPQALRDGIEIVGVHM